MKNMTRFYFKACAKCGGDMVQDRDFDGYFRKCLQCGRIVELATSAVAAVAREDERLAA